MTPIRQLSTLTSPCNLPCNSHTTPTFPNEPTLDLRTSLRPLLTLRHVASLLASPHVAHTIDDAYVRLYHTAFARQTTVSGSAACRFTYSQRSRFQRLTTASTSDQNCKGVIGVNRIYVWPSGPACSLSSLKTCSTSPETYVAPQEAAGAHIIPINTTCITPINTSRNNNHPAPSATAPAPNKHPGMTTSTPAAPCRLSGLLPGPVCCTLHGALPARPHSKVSMSRPCAVQSK